MMLLYFCFLFALVFPKLTRCGKDILEEKICAVGETVTLQCPRNPAEVEKTLYWFRLLPGNLPEFLGGTPSYDDEGYGPTSSSIKTKQEAGSFVLSINRAQMSDTGFYYCVKAQSLPQNMNFVAATFLTVKDPDSALNVESPELSGTVDSGDSVDLQCWVQTENVQCFEKHMVLWFRSGLDQSSPGLVFTQRNSSGQCNRNIEDHGPHKCFYSFSKTMSRSDAGTYRCAVAACGQIHFGNRVEVNVKEQRCVSDPSVIILLSVLLSISLIVLIILICSTKRKSGPCCFAGDNANINEHIRPPRNAELTYSAPKFNKNKSERPECTMVKAENHVVYSDVRDRN